MNIYINLLNQKLRRHVNTKRMFKIQLLKLNLFKTLYKYTIYPKFDAKNQKNEHSSSK